MPYTFRPAVESDVQAIADIYNASVMPRCDRRPHPAHLRPTPRLGRIPYAALRRFLLWNRKTVQSLASVRSPCSMTAQDMTVFTDLAITSIRHGKAGE